MDRNRRFSVRLSGLSDRPLAPGHAKATMDATLRFRPRGGGADVLGGCGTDQSSGTRSLFQRKGGWYFPFQLCPRQCAADVDAHPSFFGVSVTSAPLVMAPSPPSPVRL